MALPTTRTKATEPGVAEYLSWQATGAPASVKVHLDVIAALSAEVVEGFSALRRRGVEVGGFLVGRRENATVFIDRYERVACEYRFGPSYILSDQDKANFEEAYARLRGDEKLSIVGFYRSHTRKDLQLEQSDLEVVNRWFSDMASLFLIVKPLDITHLIAEIFFWEKGVLPMQSAGREFAFQGKGTGPFTEAKPPAVAPRAAEVTVGPPDPVPSDRVATSKESPPPPVPQFLRDSVHRPPERTFFGRYWEALTALFLVLCAGGLFLWQHSSDNDSDLADRPTSAISGTSSTRPSAPAPVTRDVPAPVSLGLEVRPSPGEWQVTWKRNLPVIQNALRGVLAIEDGGSRKRLDLNRNQLRAGSVPYRPSGDDVTFHLDVFDRDNQSSNESFRVLLAAKTGKPPTTATAARPRVEETPEKPVASASLPSASLPSTSLPRTPERAVIPDSGPAAAPTREQTVSQNPRVRQIPDLPTPSMTNSPNSVPVRTLSAEPSRFFPAAVVTRVRPEITEGIRSRITRNIVVMVKVTIDAHGRVTRALPVTRGDGLTSYLGLRAREAALKWRFEPARENDHPVSSSQVIRFVFEQ